MDFLLIGTAVLVILNIAVSFYLIRIDDLEAFQKVAQILIVWLIPFIGAIGMWIFNRDQNSDNNKPGNRSFGGGSGNSVSGGD